MLSTYLLTDSCPPSLANSVAERVLIFFLDHVHIPDSVDMFTYQAATRATVIDKSNCELYVRTARSFYTIILTV